MQESPVNQYLSFTLKDELYAISIAMVREVLEYTKITRLPKTANFMKGIINLRGQGVPVIDLAIKFGMEETAIDKDTAIIVMDVETDDGIVIVGVLADTVHEVIDLPASKVEPAPRFGTSLAADFIQGVGTLDDGFVIMT
ncbi:chemotaxis protein CheW [Spirochaetota bacterium]